MVRGGLAEGVQKGSPGGVQTELGGVQTGPNRAGRALFLVGSQIWGETQEMGQKSLLGLKSGREGPKVGPDGGDRQEGQNLVEGQIWREKRAGRPVWREMGQTGQKLPYGGKWGHMGQKLPYGRKWAIWIKPEL